MMSEFNRGGAIIGVRFPWHYLKWYPFGLSLSKPLRTLRQAQDERENLAGFCPQGSAMRVRFQLLFGS